MKTILATLDDKIAAQIEQRALAEGLPADVFLSKALQQNADKLIRPRRWMPRERWDEIASGKDCPDCAHLRSGDNPHGFVIARRKAGRLDLMRNQFVPGACVLYAYRHVTEPYELSPEERQDFFEDLIASARALADVFHPIKMNYQILGNSGPHLHAYLQPRFHGDLEPGWPIDPWKEQVLLAESEYQARVCAIREALQKTA